MSGKKREKSVLKGQTFGYESFYGIDHAADQYRQIWTQKYLDMLPGTVQQYRRSKYYVLFFTKSFNRL